MECGPWCMSQFEQGVLYIWEGGCYISACAAIAAAATEEGLLWKGNGQLKPEACV